MYAGAQSRKRWRKPARSRPRRTRSSPSKRLVLPYQRILTLIIPCAAQGKIVRQETLNIDAQFETKRKQDDVAKKMPAPFAVYGPVLSVWQCPVEPE
jgi:hypothetical protein